MQTFCSNGLEIAATALSTASDASTSLSRFMEADSGGCYTGFFTKAAQILLSAEPLATRTSLPVGIDPILQMDQVLAPSTASGRDSLASIPLAGESSGRVNHMCVKM